MDTRANGTPHDSWTEAPRGFPLRDEVEHFSGKKRVFVITCHEGAFGYTVRAEEEGKNGLGYEFSAYSETSPYSALGRVRRKMHQALATRHLARAPHGYDLMCDELRGRITVDDESRPTFVVDGTALAFEDLAGVLSSYEGWEFRLRLVDRCA